VNFSGVVDGFFCWGFWGLGVNNGGFLMVNLWWIDGVLMALFRALFFFHFSGIYFWQEFGAKRNWPHGGLVQLLREAKGDRGCDGFGGLDCAE
jgi:hypothetical protein